MSDPEYPVFDHATWMARAACRGLPTAIFFPGSGENAHSARILCDRCPVKAECLQYAVDNEISHGVWGGMSERARRRLRVKAAWRGELRDALWPSTEYGDRLVRLIMAATA